MRQKQLSFDWRKRDATFHLRVFHFILDHAVFPVATIKGGFATVKTDIINVGDEDIVDLSYTISVVGGIFNHINTQINKTIDVLEGQTYTIRAFPIVGLGKIEITITIEVEGLNPVIKKAYGFVFGILVMTK